MSDDAAEQPDQANRSSLSTRCERCSVSMNVNRDVSGTAGFVVCTRCGYPNSVAAIAFHIFYADVLRTCRRILWDSKYIEDVVQTTFLDLVREIPRGTIRDIGGWLRQTTVHNCYDKIR